MMNKILLLSVSSLVLAGWALNKSGKKPVFDLYYIIDTLESPKKEQLVTLNYTLDAKTVHLAQMPHQQPFPAADIDAANKPLVAEPYTTDVTFAKNAQKIHKNAANLPNVFYGGTLPDRFGHGPVAVPVFTKQIFNSSNFPITMETNIYCSYDGTTGNHNEYYLWLGPAQRQHYSAPNTRYPDDIAHEGLVFGGMPDRIILANKGNALQATGAFLEDYFHHKADYNQWFNVKAVFDILEGGLVVKEMYIDGQSLFRSPVAFAPVADIDWIDNFRLALCIDDLAAGLKITYNANETVNEITNQDKDINATATKSDVSTISNTPEFRAYPVPTRHQLQIDYDINEVNINNIWIIDATGKQFSLPYDVGSGKVNMDVSELPAANYYVVLYYNDNQQHTIPFVKQQ